jgi:hypothetical protein
MMEIVRELKSEQERAGERLVKRKKLAAPVRIRLATNQIKLLGPIKDKTKV